MARNATGAVAGCALLTLGWLGACSTDSEPSTSLSGAGDGGTDGVTSTAGSGGSDVDTSGGSEGDGGSDSGGSTDGPELPDPPPDSCAIDEPAFCEDFESPHPGGHAGALDEAKWGFSRWGHDLGNVFHFFPASTDAGFAPQATMCGTSFDGLLPPDAIAICEGADAAGVESLQLQEAFHDTGDFAFYSMLIRQPFDFADRTGTIVLDTELKFNPFNVGHGWWVEVWVVEDPVVVPYHGAPAVASFPRNGVGFAFEGFNCDKLAWENSLTRFVVTEDYEIRTDGGGGECFQTAEGVLNHLEIRLSQDRAEVWVSDAGEPETLRQVASMDGLDLPFSRGHVVLQHSAYNAAKDEGTPSQTYRWDNVGFDGPILPRVRGYEVPDNTEDDGQTYGWRIDGSGRTFTIADVDPSDMGSAVFNVSMWPLDGEPTIEFRLNGGSWNTFVPPDDPGGYQLHSYAIPFDIAQVQTGDNTLEVRSTGPEIPVGNLDVTLIP